MEMKAVEFVQENWGESPEAILYQQDCLQLLKDIVPCTRGKVQMIYLDPPFMSGRSFNAGVQVTDDAGREKKVTMTAYQDRQDLESYTDLMSRVISGSRALLRPDGTIFVHVDRRASGIIRRLLDECYGPERLINEIIWCYESGGRSRRSFSHKHDTLFFYGNSKKYFFDLKAVPMGVRSSSGNHMKRSVDEDGRPYRSIRSGGREYRYYDDEMVYPSDVWTDIPHLQQRHPERRGFDTQKPEKLLQRVIRCSTRPGDLVCDLFTGSGTTAVAALREGRRFLGADESPVAVGIAASALCGMKNRSFWIVGGGAAGGEARLEADETLQPLSYTSPDTLREHLAPLSGIRSWARGKLDENGIFHRTDQDANALRICDQWGNRRVFVTEERQA